MSEADCGVFPARAEGWNLELLEMMSLGKQVIATNYSAHTQFCTPNNCHLIHTAELEPAYDGVFFGNDSVGNWARLDNDQLDQLVERMRAVHKNPHEPNTTGIETAQVFSWERAARRIVDYERIWG
jgi:glycosyltransferase involved in cell wall biosynthesis